MNTPTDKQIFNHMMPDYNLDCCEKCGGEIKEIDCAYYVTYECLNCGYTPTPPEED